MPEKVDVVGCTGERKMKKDHTDEVAVVVVATALAAHLLNQQHRRKIDSLLGGRIFAATCSFPIAPCRQKSLDL